MWPRSRRAYNIRPEELIEEEDWEFTYGFAPGVPRYAEKAVHRAKAKNGQDVTRAAKRIVKLMKELGH
jgi:hypothetical protein